MTKKNKNILWSLKIPINLNKLDNEIKEYLTVCEKKLGIVPNILNITYGRDVGYKIEQEKFDKQIEEISATKIRSEGT